ncbi:GNAT family N-acetyltransferase [Photobacterium chitinilyticum]|uniref:GNAT family N-acetyltransferase n=1 Tax=Photobacterium chitinilyticum TaxID=2485123 RepID=A0A3S3SUZ3_9GAMM|nr:GNAT family N-acetyltransferase [Photobacterium chitinilyticum]RWX52672.1 GNAT family N-acetyltransferase [Photobacterium chitinilyticum]
MEIVLASSKYENEYCEYVLECHRHGIELYSDAVSDPKSYLQRVIANSEGRMLPEGWVPMSTYFCIENDRILGAIRIRKENNDYIRNVIGHIGYETRPSERGRGVAKALLLWLKENQLITEAILICSSDNGASRSVIESCGGILLKSDDCNNEYKNDLRFKLLRA